MWEFRSGLFAMVGSVLIRTGSLAVQDVGLKPSNSLDARGFGVELGDEAWKTLQERAYASPIWYTP